MGVTDDGLFSLGVDSEFCKINFVTSHSINSYIYIKPFYSCIFIRLKLIMWNKKIIVIIVSKYSMSFCLISEIIQPK